MKKILLFSLLVICIAWKSNAQIVNIPDPNFKAVLVGNPEINTNGDTEIQQSEAKAYAGSLKVQTDFENKVKDLTGIEAFTAIKELNCSGNELKSIDLSKNVALEILNCSINEIKSLDLSNNVALEILNCSFNHLNSLNLTKNLALKKVNCEYNGIEKLNISKNLALEYLSCGINYIDELDLSKHTKLTELSCFSTGISKLNVANGNNHNFTLFVASRNGNLTCIQVDKGFIPSPEIWKRDTLAEYSFDCGVFNTQVWYADQDGDGFGNSEDSLISGTQPADHVLDNTDCNDANKNIYPGATEIIGNGIDENCDGVDEKIWYADKDGDGYGNSVDSLISGTQPTDYVLDKTDCDDTNKGIYPGATEIIGNGIDENCDGMEEKVWYADKDGDGYGNSIDSLISGTQPTDYVLDKTDCDDTNKDIYPGAAEIAGNQIDENCDGVIEQISLDLTIELTTSDKQSVSKANIILYQKLNGGIILIKDIAWNDIENPLFDSLDRGNYFIKVIPDLESNPNLLTTYSGDSPLQAEAEIFVLDSNLIYTIELIELIEDSSGGGKIEGFALLKENNSGGRITTGAEETGTPIANLPVFLFPINSNKVVGFSKTDEDGKFQFGGLTDNKYYLKADYNGIPVDIINSEIEISKENSLQVSVIIGDKIITEINEFSNLTFTGKIEVFPNPVTNTININFDKGTKVFNIQVLDLSGRILQNRDFSNLSELNVQLDLSDLPYGIYQLFLNTNQGSATWKVLKEQ